MPSNASHESSGVTVELRRRDTDRAPDNFREQFASLDIDFDDTSIVEVIEALVLKGEFHLWVGEVRMKDETAVHHHRVGDDGFG